MLAGNLACWQQWRAGIKTFILRSIKALVF